MFRVLELLGEWAAGSTTLAPAMKRMYLEHYLKQQAAYYQLIVLWQKRLPPSAAQATPFPRFPPFDEFDKMGGLHCAHSCTVSSAHP